MHYHIEILDLVKIPPNIDFSDNLNFIHTFFTNSFITWGRGARVKQRSFNLHLLIKLHVQISCMQLSFGFSLCKRWVHSATKKAKPAPFFSIQAQEACIK